MEPEVIGRVDMVVMRNGKAPMRVEGIDEWQLLNVLSSQITHINERIAGKPLKLTEEEKKKIFYMVANLFGANNGFEIINALSWCINRVAAKMERDKKKSIPLILTPDAWGGPFL